MLKKASHPGSIAEVAARLAGGAVHADIGMNRLSKTFQLNRDLAGGGSVRLARRADAVRREKVVVPGDVNMIVADVPGGHDQFAAGGIRCGFLNGHHLQSVKQRRRFLSGIALRERIGVRE